MSKGKAHKRFEFDTKASVTTTRDSGIIIGALAFEKNIYDGHTVPDVLAQVKRLLGRVPAVGIGDRGKSKVNDTQIVTPKRAGIEPVIGHLKSDHRLKRNFLKGFAGDQINLIMAAAAFNFKKWMREVIFWLKKLKQIIMVLETTFSRVNMALV